MSADPNTAAPAETVDAAPVEAGREPVDSVKPSVTVSIGSQVFIAIALSALTLFVVATPLTWFSRRVPEYTTAVSLWKVTNTSSNALESTTYEFVLDMTCEDRRQRFRALEAFAILSIGGAFAMLLSGIAAHFAKKTLTAAKITSVLTFAVSLVAWAMALALYYKNGLCGHVSFSQQKFEFDVGVGLFVTGWVLTFLALVVAVVNPTIPEVLPNVVITRVVLTLFAVIQVLALILTVIGTPTQWFYRWENSNTLHRVSIWSSKTYVNEVLVSETDLKDVNCNEFAKIAKFGEAFTIISIGTTLVSVVVCALAARGTLGMKAAILSGLSSFTSTLITFAAGLTLYFRQYCASPSLDSQRFVMTGGFVLFGCAFVISAVGLIVLIVVSLSQLLADKTNVDGNTRWTAFLFIAATAIAILFQVVAADQPLFGSMTNDFNWVRYTFWRIYIKTAGVASVQEFGCTAVEQRLVGAGALNIISIVIKVIALIIGITQLTSATMRKAASIVLGVSNLALLVSWALVAAVYTLEYCGNTFGNGTFELLQGFGLLISAWIFSVLSGILNWTNGPLKREAAVPAPAA